MPDTKPTTDRDVAILRREAGDGTGIMPFARADVAALLARLDLAEAVCKAMADFSSGDFVPAHALRSVRALDEWMAATNNTPGASDV